MKTLIHGRVSAVEMPLDAYGNGPATEEDTVIVKWEVWDQVCQTICVCRHREDAEGIVDLLNTTAVWPRYMFREDA